MAFLRLPLELNSAGAFERSATHEDYLQTRLRVFILSGASKYLLLPSPGISSLWLQLTTIGPTSKFCGKDVFPENERRQLEDTIKKEANIWLEGNEEITDVTIFGDGTVPNGILFRTAELEFSFTFEFAMPGMGRQKGTLGNWNIREHVNVIR